MDAAVFLDRDNTIIHNDGDLGDPAAVQLIKGAASAVASLRGLGYRVVVVSNQGGVARGKFEEADVDAVNRRINDLIHATTGASIDRFYYCPYHPDGTVEKYRKEHPWRKPQPGMILQAAKDLKLDLSRCWTVGDAMRDVEAGAAAGTRTILLSADKAEATIVTAAPPDHIAESLIEAVRLIAQQRSREGVAREPSPNQETQTRRPIPARDPSEAVADAPSPRPDDPLEEVDDPPRTPGRDVEHEDHGGPPALETVKPTGASRREGDTAALLRQILQEMRDQRDASDEFSYTTVMAIVLQMLAAVFLLASFYFGWDNQDQFIRWMGAALLTQMGTVAMLLFGR